VQVSVTCYVIGDVTQRQISKAQVAVLTVINSCNGKAYCVMIETSGSLFLGISNDWQMSREVLLKVSIATYHLFVCSFVSLFACLSFVKMWETVLGL
jgi:hypothetical protein